MSKHPIIRVLKFVFFSLMLLSALITIIGGGFGNRKNDFLVNKGQSIVFAHRGIGNYYVENSLEAFVNSKKLGFEAIELDLRFTKDNKLVIFHDKNSKRLLGLDGNISELNFDDIKDKYLLFEGEYTENKVLLFSQFLEQFGQSKILYLDIKEPSKQIADTLLSYLQVYNSYNTTLIANSNIFFLAYLKIKNPKVLTVLEGYKSAKESLYYVIPKKIRPNFYASSLLRVDKELAQFMKDNYFLDKMIVWGVNYKNLDKVIELGIQNVIIDYDSLLGSHQNIVDLLK